MAPGALSGRGSHPVSRSKVTHKFRASTTKGPVDAGVGSSNR